VISVSSAPNLSVVRESASTVHYPLTSAVHNHLSISTIPSLTTKSSFPHASHPSATGDSNSNPNAVNVNDTSSSAISPSQAGTNNDPQDNGRPKYTRRLVHRILAEPDDTEADDQQAWNKKVYGPEVIIIGHKGAPPGWIMIAGISCICSLG